MSVTEAATEIRDEFAFLDDWEMRYAHIIDLGKNLEALPLEQKTEMFKVKGCASQVWIVPEGDNSCGDSVRFAAQSDAIIVSGLIVLLKRLFNDQKAGEILDFDTSGFFAEIGLDTALSAQRSNGLASMVARIRDLAGAKAT